MNEYSNVCLERLHWLYQSRECAISQLYTIDIQIFTFLNLENPFYIIY